MGQHVTFTKACWYNVSITTISVNYMMQRLEEAEKERDAERDARREERRQESNR